MTNRTLMLAAAASMAALVALSVAPAPLQAQGQGEAEATGNQDLMAELQEIQGRLTEIRQEAMQDPKLRERQTKVQEKITSAMTEIDPEAERKLARVGQIQQEMQTAQEEGEQEKVGSLIQEAQQLQLELQRTQSEAMARDGVQQAVEEFRDVLFDKMREIDPEAAGLIERAEEITVQLEEQPAGG